MNTGIYIIRNKTNGKAYVGSAVNFDSRWRVHKHHLRKKTHHCTHLQSAWSQSGEDAFEFKKVLVCSKENLIFYEQILIDGYKTASREHGYNARPIADSLMGHKHSPETREKIRMSRAKQTFSAETRALWSKNRTGRKMPAWFSDFTRSHRTGATHTAEAKAKISAFQKGVPHTLSRVENRSKLTQTTADQIRAKYALGGVTQSELASEYLIDQSSVSLILSGKRWGKFLPKEN